jgi:hypothetical protein
MAWYECGFYLIKSRLNDFVLDVFSSSQSAGAALVAFPLNGGHGSSNQQWRFTESGLICSRLNNYVVDISGEPSHSGTALVNTPEQGTASQHWELVPVPNSHYFLIKNKVAGLVMDISGSSLLAAAQVIAYRVNGEFGTPNQQWELVPVPALLNNGQIDAEAVQIPSEYPTVPGLEVVPEGEAEEIRKVIGLTFQLLQRRYPPTKQGLRGVHAKDHGCVKATLTLLNDIPEQYRIGVFATPGKIYDAWVRFSNATPFIDNDANKSLKTGALEASSRGMAIKLLNVEGKTLLDIPGEQSQDFLMINTPMFAFGTVSDYLALTQIQVDNHENILPFFMATPLPPSRAKSAGIVGQIKTKHIGNPLDAQYFTASPFLFGPGRAAKFSVKPRNPENTPLPADAETNPNFLRAALKKSLDPASGKTVVFDFLVQLRTGGEATQPIEDAATEWKDTDKEAPYRVVGTLVIEPQDFDTPERRAQCEHMVFTPWHGLVEHQPLGGTNRMRLGVYAASSKYRR